MATRKEIENERSRLKKRKREIQRYIVKQWNANKTSVEISAGLATKFGHHIKPASVKSRVKYMRQTLGVVGKRQQGWHTKKESEKDE